MIQQMLATWSLVPLPFLKPAWTSRSSWFTYCWSLAWRILTITLLVCEMSAIVREFEHSLALPFFGIGFEWKLTFSCPVATAEFSKFAGILSAALSQHHLSGFEIVKEESEEVGLKPNIQKTKIMTSSPITSWEIDGETVEIVSGFCVLGLQNHYWWWLQSWN